MLPHLSERTLARARRRGTEEIVTRAAHALAGADADTNEGGAAAIASEVFRLAHVRSAQQRYKQTTQRRDKRSKDKRTAAATVEAAIPENGGADWCAAARVIRDARVVRRLENSRDVRLTRKQQREAGARLSHMLTYAPGVATTISAAGTALPHPRRSTERDLEKEVEELVTRHAHARDDEKAKEKQVVAASTGQTWQRITEMLSMLAMYKHSTTNSQPFFVHFMAVFPKSPVITKAEWQMGMAACLKCTMTASVTSMLCAVFDFFRLDKDNDANTRKRAPALQHHVDARFPLLWLTVLSNPTISVAVRPDAVAENVARLDACREKLNFCRNVTLAFQTKQTARALTAASSKSAQNVAALRKRHGALAAQVKETELLIHALEEEATDRVRVLENDTFSAKQAIQKCILAAWSVMGWSAELPPPTQNDVYRAMQSIAPQLQYDALFPTPHRQHSAASPTTTVDWVTIESLADPDRLSADVAFSVAQAMWNACSDTLRATELERRVRVAEHKFVQAFKPLKRNILYLMHRFSKLKRFWKRMRQYTDTMVARKNAIRGVHHYRMRRGLRHFHKRIVALKSTRRYFLAQRPIVDTWFLRLVFHRWRRIASRMRSYKIACVHRVEDILFLRIGLRNVFGWWKDVINEGKGSALAKRYNDAVVRRGWFRRLRNYTKRCVNDRRIAEMRIALRLAEDAERQIDDAATSSFFLDERQKKAREERVEARRIKNEEDRYEAIWEKQRRSANQVVIKIQQAKDRVAHKKDTSVKAKQARDDTWDTLASTVLPRVADTARTWCSATPKGKIFVREKADELKQMRLGEAQRRLRQNSMNPEGCEWVAVNELPGVFNSAVAWTHTTSRNSIKWSRMTYKNCKQIAIARYVAMELNKVKAEFEQRRVEADAGHKKVQAALIVQKIYRMRQHRRIALDVFNARTVLLLDVYSGSKVWYNLLSREYSYQRPLFLNNHDRVQLFSMHQARGPTEMSDMSSKYWYEYRPPPYRPENKPKSIAWTVPAGILLCEQCQVCVCRRRCRGAACVHGSTPIYLCFYCYDEIHPSGDGRSEHRCASAARARQLRVTDRGDV